jgi:prolyl oligopeptidase
VFRLFLESFFTLLSFERYLAQHNFTAIYAKVHRQPINHRSARVYTIDQIGSATNLACIWYPKEVLCLQRSAAMTCVLKRYGLHAQMVIGAQRIPFKAHAWVEVDGLVVNDLLYTPEMYTVLDRC